MTPLRERLYEDEAVLGTFVTLDAPAVVELAGWVGLDFVVLDLEHGGLSPDAIEPAVRAADAADIELMVRLPEIRRGPILRSLDAGAAGILVPQVETPGEARRAVEFCRFPPGGRRGAALGRYARYGLDDVEDVFRRADERTVLAVQCESEASRENVEELAAVDGVDVVFLGPFDYSVSVGRPGQLDHEEVEEAARAIVRATREGAARPGVFVADRDAMKRRRKQGYRFIVLSSDVLFLMNRLFAARGAFDGMEGE